MKAALYLRVSTDKQTTSNQLPDLMRYVEFHKWNVVETYIDEDVSGKKISRPAFDRMMLDAHLNKFDVVLVVRLDRLSRSVKHLLSTLEVLDKLGIGFASVTQNIDTTTAAGKLLFTILGAMAEFESTLISERTKAGLARVRKDGSKSGRRIGRPTRDICALKLTQMRSQGMSARRIALELNVPLTTLHRRLA